MLSIRRLLRATLAIPLVTLVAWPAAAQQECDVRGAVEAPTEDAVVTNRPVVISGWAADVTAADGTGISEVRVALDAEPDQGGVPVPALYGWQRPDVADLLGAPRFQASGLALSWDATGTTPGRHTLYIQARSACGWITVTRTVLVAGTSAAPAAGPTPTRAPGVSAPGAAPQVQAPASAPGGVPQVQAPAVVPGGAPQPVPPASIPGSAPLPAAPAGGTPPGAPLTPTTR